MEQAIIKLTDLKTIVVFFPVKPILNKFRDEFVQNKISEFIYNLKPYTSKVTAYRIDNEKFFDFELTEDDNGDIINTMKQLEVIPNKTVVLTFAIDKNINLDVTDILEKDIFPYINVIRMHKKKHEEVYYFYTVNSTNTLNKMMLGDVKTHGKNTFFILSANNAKTKNQGAPSTKEKYCPANYLGTIYFERIKDESHVRNVVKKKIVFS